MMVIVVLISTWSCFPVSESRCLVFVVVVICRCVIEYDVVIVVFFFFSSRRRHTRFDCDWSSDVCSSDLTPVQPRSRATQALSPGCHHRTTSRCDPRYRVSARSARKQHPDGTNTGP